LSGNKQLGYLLRVPCAKCGVSIDIEAEKDKDIYMFKCGNCGRGIALTATNVISVKPESLDALLEKYGYDITGTIEGVDMSDRFSLIHGGSGGVGNLLSDEYIESLKTVVSREADASDIVKDL